MNHDFFWHIFQLTLFGALSQFFLFKVFKDSIKITKSRFLAGSVLYLVTLNVISCLFFTQISPFLEYSILGILLFFILTAISYKIITDKKFIFLVFTLFLLLNVQNSAFYLARATLAFHFWPQYCLYENGDLLILSSIYGVLFFAAVDFTIFKYYKKMLSGDIFREHKYILFGMPILFYIANALVGKNIKKIFAGIPKEFFVPLLLWDACALLAYFLTLKSITDHYEAATEKEKLLAAQNQLNLWEAQYKKLDDKIHLEARARHDWRQHFIAIEGFAETRDIEGLERYLGDYKDKTPIEDCSPLCDIPSLNILFQYYQCKAKEINIQFSINRIYFGECGISVSDLTVLFGNLLENAIAACRTATDANRYIHLKIVKEKNQVLFICVNGFREEEEKKKGKILQSSTNSGFGISSMQRIVEKYGGHLQLSQEAQVFKVQAYLQIAT